MTKSLFTVNSIFAIIGAAIAKALGDGIWHYRF